MGPNNIVKDKQCEGTTTTEQLLADLTDDFEEAITAQICLSNQFLDANLETVESVKEDILILKSENLEVEHNQLSMELNTKGTPTSTTASATRKQQEDKNSAADDEISTVAAKIRTEETVSQSGNETDDAIASGNDEEVLEKEPAVAGAFSLKESGDAVESPSGSTTVPTTTKTVDKPGSSHLTILAEEELPPIRTDSTMTASEVEDNIEERLSQLDGSPVIEPSTTEASEVDTSVLDAISAERPSTPPPLATAGVAKLQQQFEETPTRPAHTQPQHIFVPQSSGSSVTTISSSGIHVTKDFLKDSSAGELEDQDIEEVLKALKGLDSSATADTICDLNVLFNEVYTTLNYEEINSQHNSSGCGSKLVNPLKEMQAEIEKKHLTMHRKIEFLLRRLRKMQARYMCKHASEEISGLFEWTARIAAKSAKPPHEDDVADRQQLNTAEEKSHPVTSTQLANILRKIETVANAQQLTTATTSTSGNSLVRRKTAKKIATTTNAAQVNTAAGSSENNVNSVTVVPTFDQSVTDEIGHVAGLLQSEMHEAQQAMDSDATESSSGGESADEMVTYNNQTQQSLKITKRAAWRYSRDRAAIASRWSWLLSQVSDLEIKIRQHSELRQELLRTKGPILVENDSSATATTTPSASATPNATPFNGYKGTQSMPAMEEMAKDNDEAVDEDSSCCRTRGMLSSHFRKRKIFQTENIHTFSKKAARPSTIKCGCQWPLLPCTLCTGRADPTSPRDLPDTMMMADRVALLDPGYHPVLSFPGDISNSIHFEAICRLPDWQQRVVRCSVKNIAKNVWRAERDARHASVGKKIPDSAKRKYIKKKDLLRQQQRQQQQQQQQLEQQQMQANNGNGTGTFSMSSTPLVANKLRKSHDMTMKTLLPSPRINNHHNNNSSNHNNNSSNHYHHQYPQTTDYHQLNYAQYNPSLAHSSSISTTVRNSKNRKLSSSATATASNSNFHYNHLHSNDYSNSELNYLYSDSWDSQVTRSRTSSPTHSGSKKNKSLDRRNRTSYDIDNIVIPYSVAAATRVELLPYKEIPTPKWRVIEEDSNELPMFSEYLNLSPQNSITHLKDDESPRFDYNHQNETSDSKTYTSALSAEDIISGKKQTPPTNNAIVASATNNCVETTVTMSPNAKEAMTDSSLNNKCRLTTKRTYSEKENSVDPIDAFDTIKDSNTKSLHSTTVKTSYRVEPNANKTASTENDDKMQKDRTTDDLQDGALNHRQLEEKEQNEINNINTSFEFIDEFIGGVEEDITDEAMILRHERALIEERQRLRFPWSTRSRANRRIDSRVDWSSGANTPDPASPAANTPSLGGGDFESIPSPAAPPTPVNPLDSTAESADTVFNNSPIAPPPTSWLNYNNKRSERRRTTSAKNNKEPDRRSTSPDPKDLFPPYEPRKFPISNEVFENMMKIDNIVNALSSTKSKNLEYNSKNETVVARKINHKNNTINSLATTLNHREFGSEQDDSSEIGFNEIDSFMQPNLLAGMDEDYQLGYEAAATSSHRRRNHLIDDDVGYSDIDTSDAEPFSDDDPNDPEWKGETEEKDKIRRKL